MVFGSIPSPTKKRGALSSLNPLRQNFLDPRMPCTHAACISIILVLSFRRSVRKAHKPCIFVCCLTGVFTTRTPVVISMNDYANINAYPHYIQCSRARVCLTRPLMGHRQTVQNQTRRHRTRRLIRFLTICFQNVLLKFEYIYISINDINHPITHIYYHTFLFSNQTYV